MRTATTGDDDGGAGRPQGAAAALVSGAVRAAGAARRVAAGATRRVPRRVLRSVPWPLPRPAGVSAILFDRDGTLVHDVPYNGDPALVDPVAGARAALARVRRRRIRTAVVTNQSGVARGLLTPVEVAAVNARVDDMLGPFDSWQVCPHGPDQGCACRKPQPGMILAAARRIGVPPHLCVVIGDTGSDVEAALRAGARAVLVPNAVTRPEEVEAAPLVAGTLPEAVDLVLSGRV